MKKFALLLSAAFIVFFACEKIDNPFPPDQDLVDTGRVWTDSVFSKENDGKRFVLMEEYTGHTCTNCPAGAAEVERLTELYDGKLVPMSVHASSFATPKPGYGNTGDGFSSDYRTEAGEAYLAPFNITGLPGGLVSRVEAPGFGQTAKLSITAWQAEIDKIIGEPAVANISISNYYNDTSNVYQIRVRIEWLIAHAGDLNLQVQLLEDSIQDWQQDARFDPNPYIEDYWHRHMFREPIDGTWGEELEAADANEIVETVYTRDFDANDVGYKIQHMIVVAFLYKRGGPVYEVMQVNEAHLTSSH